MARTAPPDTYAAGTFPAPLADDAHAPPVGRLPDLERLPIDRPGPDLPARPPQARPYRPDTVLDGWSAEPFTVRAASIRGDDHRVRAIPRQDDMSVVWHHPTGAVVLAVADGVSDAPDSHIGATIACRYAVNRAVEGLDSGQEIDWTDLVHGAAYHLLDYGTSSLHVERDQVVRVLATTLTIAVVWPRDPDKAVVDAVQVGDSPAWILDDHGYRDLMPGKVTSGEVVSAAVRALPQVPDPVRPTTVVMSPGQVLLIGTDGFGDPLGSGDGLVGRLFADALATPPSPARFGYLLDFSRETFDDDRTLVAVWFGRRE